MSLSRILSNIPSNLSSNIGQILFVNNNGGISWRVDTASSNTVYLQGALNQTNTIINYTQSELSASIDYS